MIVINAFQIRCLPPRYKLCIYLIYIYEAQSAIHVELKTTTA